MEIARIRVPESLGLRAIRELSDALAQAGADPACGLVVLEGASDFCRGLDFRELAEEAAGMAAAVAAFGDCLERLGRTCQPTLALVAGAAAGGGVGLAAACDVVIAEQDATFALPELLLGLTPAVILPVLLGRVSSQQLRLWAFQGRSFDAPSALAIGLVDEVVPAGEGGPAIRRWERMLRRAEPRAVARFKRLLADEAGWPTESIRRGVALTAATLTDETVVGPLRAFARDGVPPWEVR